MKNINDEIINKYQVRKSGKQKEEFREYIKTRANNYGYENVIIESGGKIIKSNNIIIGNPETAKMIFTAHYDTCALSPFPNFMFPTNPVMFIISQLLIFGLFLFIGFWAMVIAMLISPGTELAALYIVILGLCFQIMFGYRNKHTANDNTSGVIALLKIMEQMPEKERDKVCFVFFDNEEKGMFGSRLFRRDHKEFINNKLLVNFDCVGDGNNILFAARKEAMKDDFYSYLKEYDKKKNYGKKIIVEKIHKLLFPSDQVLFEKSIAVCGLKKTKIIGLHAGRIHTKRDKICQENNILCISDIIIGYSNSH